LVTSIHHINKIASLTSLKMSYNFESVTVIKVNTNDPQMMNFMRARRTSVGSIQRNKTSLMHTKCSIKDTLEISDCKSCIGKSRG
jgi:hypothetical protein